MKTYVLNYGAYPRHNEIVTKHLELTKISEGIYYSLLDEDLEDHDRDDLLLILKVGSVYFVQDNRYRKDIFAEKYLENMALVQKNWVEIVKKNVSEGKYIRNMEIAVFRALGLDTSELVNSREAALKKREEEKRIEAEEYERKKEERRQRAEKEENERLDQVKADFLDNELIPAEDFLAITKRDGFNIHIRTMGTIRQRLTRLKRNGEYYYRNIKGKRKPDTTGFGEALAGYIEFLEKQDGNGKA